MEHIDETSDFLGKEDVRKLLVRLSTPMIIGMVVQALYNVIDTVFVARAYEAAESVKAIRGLSVAFSIQMIIMALGIFIGTRGVAIISRALGTKEIRKAEKVLGNVFTVNLIVSILIGVFFLIYIDPLLHLFGATQGVLPYAKQYVQIIIAGGIVFVFVFILGFAMGAV
jgi:Na+-driven multidrug efflux pump